MLMRITLILSLLVVALSCGTEPIGPTSMNADVLIAHSGTNPALADARFPPVARVQDGALVVLGAIGTPTPCFDVRGTMLGWGNEIGVRVVSSELPGVCITVVASFQYRVARALAPGRYRVRVTHEGSSGRAAVVLDTLVEVP